jgi:hypothetical protein
VHRWVVFQDVVNDAPAPVTPIAMPTLDGGRLHQHQRGSPRGSGSQWWTVPRVRQPQRIQSPLQRARHENTAPSPTRGCLFRIPGLARASWCHPAVTCSATARARTSSGASSMRPPRDRAWRPGARVRHQRSRTGRPPSERHQRRSRVPGPRDPSLGPCETMTSDALWKYVSVRRLFIFLERSIYEGTQWVVFERL